MYNWRQHKRERYEGAVDITLNVIKAHTIEEVRYHADIVDISHGGLGVISDFPLERGFVRLNGELGSRSGVVVWSGKIGNDKYRSGIRFDHPFTIKGTLLSARKLQEFLLCAGLLRGAL